MKIMTPGSTGNLKRAKLLIVEDNDDQWFMISHALRQCLSEVKAIRVSSIHQAKELLEEWADQEWEIPRLILLDLYLPTAEEGWQLVRHIKMMSEPFNRIPLVMLSSSEARDDIEAAYQQSISSYLTKPICLDDWVSLFCELRTYWWETVTLPPIHYKF